MTISEKAAYLCGLADGVDLDKNTKEGKLISALIDLVGDMAEAIESLQSDVEDLNDYADELDEDLGAVEDVLYGDDDDEYGECDGDCSSCDSDCDLDDENFFEVECPACGETVCFDESIDPEELVCPACGEKFECIVSEDDLKVLDGE